jgi:hypothetical protein
MRAKRVNTWSNATTIDELMRYLASAERGWDLARYTALAMKRAPERGWRGEDRDYYMEFVRVSPSGKPIVGLVVVQAKPTHEEVELTHAKLAGLTRPADGRYPVALLFV